MQSISNLAKLEIGKTETHGKIHFYKLRFEFLEVFFDNLPNILKSIYKYECLQVSVSPIQIFVSENKLLRKFEHQKRVIFGVVLNL